MPLDTKTTKAVIVLLSVLTIVSTLDVKLEKDFFFVGTNNKFHSTLYQTSKHVIAQSIEFPSNSQAVPQYLALDLTTGNATQILNDVSAACDPAPYVFGKLIYHDASSRLVYYCANNNTLLYLDEEDFRVTDTIVVGGNTVYSETRLTLDGDFLVVIGIQDFFGGEQASISQFMRLNLVTKQVTGNFSFDGLLSASQTVVGFTSNKLESHILATQLAGTNVTASLYLLVSLQSVVKLVPVTSFTYDTNGSTVINHLHCYGNYVITNTATNLLFINQLGSIAYNYTNITSTKVYVNPTDFAWELSFGMQYQSTDLYVLFNNDTIEHFTVSGASLSSVPIGTAAQMMVVIGSQMQADLLFIISDQGPLFNVMKAQTQEIIYSRPNGYRNLMLTNSTYAAELYPYLFIFDSTNDTLIANITIGLFYYHDTDNGVVYFLNSTSNVSCQLIGLDLASIQFKVITEFNDSMVCAGVITAMDCSDPNSPQASIALVNSSLLIITKSNGVLLFNPPAPTSGRNVVSYSVIDFGTLNLEYISSQDFQVYTVAFYTYDQSSNTFVSHSSTGFKSNTVVPLFHTYTVGSTEVVAVANQAFAYFNITASDPIMYKIAYRRAQMSMFHDKDGQTYMIFAEDPAYALVASNQTPYLFDSSNLQQLPETSAATTGAGAAGFCSYWIVDGMISSVGIVKFYQGCSDSRTEMIYS